MSKNIDVVTEVVRVLNLEGASILQCADRLKNQEAADSLKKAVVYFHESLDQGGKIIVTGVGKSGKVGQKIAATLSSTGSLAVFLHPTEGLHGDLGVVRPQDVIFALSYTGNTEELIRLVPSFKNLRVKMVGLGGNPNSKLAVQCDAWIDARVDQEACPHNLTPTASTTLALAMGDALSLALMQLRGFDAKSFAQNHPGGSLGKRLSLRVEGLMHRDKSVPTVSPDASIKEVVVALTQKKLGAVLVVEGTKLLGIITDGDIRRSLQIQEKFFQLKANEVMTSKPVTASPEMMAQTALELMENRPSQISVLPVVDDQGNWKGILRLHDLIQSF